MQYTFGLIGSGNMGGGIARAVRRTTEDGLLADHHRAHAEKLAQELGFAVGTNEEVARSCRYVYLGVKPHLIAAVLSEIAPLLREDAVVVSMAAGVTVAQIQGVVGARPVIRIMPNTPVSVGQGVVLFSASDEVAPEQLDGFLKLMHGAGGVYPIDEGLIDAATAVSGCGPAFAYLMIDAMADGGVAGGLRREDAVRYAAQTLLGAAAMVLETGKHPEQLKNEVCSPGGSTIQGVRLLEQRAVRAALMDAVLAAYEKSAALGK